VIVETRGNQHVKNKVEQIHISDVGYDYRLMEYATCGNLVVDHQNHPLTILWVWPQNSRRGSDGNRMQHMEPSWSLH
jgi:hypothetical protein